jgi:hypothetical protein
MSPASARQALAPLRMLDDDVCHAWTRYRTSGVKFQKELIHILFTDYSHPLPALFPGRGRAPWIFLAPRHSRAKVSPWLRCWHHEP